jgi:phage shock protein E
MMAEFQSWTQWLPVILLAGAALVVFLMVRPVSAAEARRLVQRNAKVIDVRSAEEFAAGAVKGAINLPLGEVTARIQSIVPDKSTPVLVHCLSGGRSAIARRMLRSLGYRQVHNLGSLHRAKRIVEQ